MYIVVAPASDDPESPSIGLTANSFRHFDARKPVALLDGEVIVDYNETEEEISSYIAAISHPSCFLERTAPEDESPA